MLNEKLKILVVDDEVDIADLICFNLEVAGFEVVTSLSVDEAIQQLAKHQFNAVISDMRMPKKTGIDLVNHLKSNSINIPIYIYTGFSEAEDSTLINMGVSEVFHKPTDLKQMVQQVTNLKLAMS